MPFDGTLIAALWGAALLLPVAVAGRYRRVNRALQSQLRCLQEAEPECERRKVEFRAALDEQEKRYREVFENSSDAMFVIDVERRCHFSFDSLNPAAEKAFGMPAATLKGLTFGEIIDGKLGPGSGAALADAMVHCLTCALTGMTTEYEAALDLRPRSVEKTDQFHIRLIPLADDGGIVRIIGIGRDVTPRREYEAELRRQADFQQTLLDAISRVGIQLLVIEEGRIVHVGNRDLAYAAGYTDEDIDARPPFADIVHPDDRPLVMELHRRRLAGEATPDSYSVGMVARDGSRREYETSIAVVPGTYPVRVITIGKDVTERSRNAEQRNRLQEQLAAVAEAVPGFLFTIRVETDGRSHFPYASSGVERLFGLRPENIRADAGVLGARYHQDDLARMRELMLETERTLAPFRIEVRVNHPDRGQRWIEVRSTPQRQADGATEWHGLMVDISERKRMETSLREREREFRSLAENSPDTVVRWDTEGRYLYVNPTLQKVRGLNRDTIGERIADAFPDGRYAQVAAGVAQVIATGQATRIARLPVPSASGEICLHDLALVPEFDDSGRIVTVLGIGRDMTETYRLQESLAVREQEFRSLAESSPDFIIRYDREHRIRFLNSKLVRLLGLGSADEVIGRRPAEAWPDGRYDAIDEGIAKAIACGEATTTEVGESSTNGQGIYQIFVVPERNSNGEIIGAIAVGRDITTIRAAERQLHHLIENLPGLAYSFRRSSDGDAGIPYISGGVEDLFGIPPEQAQGDYATIRNLMHPDDRPLVDAAIEESARTMAPLRVESRICRPGQPERWVTARSLPTREADGSIVWYGIMFDITARKEAELAATAAFEQLMASLRTIPDPMFELDRKGTYLEIWENDEALLAADRERLLGRRIADVLPPGAAAIAMAALREADLNGASRGYIIQLPGGDEARYSELSIAKRPGSCAAEDRFIALSRDVTDRVLHAQSLQERISLQDQIASVAQAIPGFLYTTHIDAAGNSTFPFATDGIEQLLGLRPEDIRENPAALRARYHPDDLPRLMESIREARRTLAPFRQEIRALHPEHGLRWIDIRSTPTRLPNGTIEAHGLMIDITERKRMEEALEDSLRFARELIEVIPGPVFYKDVQGRYLGCNGAFASQYGKSPDEIVGKTVFDLWPPDLAQRYAAADQELFDNPGTQIYEAQIEAPTGRRNVMFHKATFRRTDGSVGGQVGVILDITERIRMEAAIDKERTTLRAFFTTLPDMVWMKDTEGRYLACNPLFERFFGAPEAEIVGKTDFDFVDAELAAFFRQKDHDAISAGRPTVNEEWITFADDGKRVLLETVKTPVRDAAGNVFGVLGIGHDITERHAMEAAREDALNEARRLAQARSAFLARMSHELRTPLNGILGYAQNMLRDANLNEKQTARLAIIQQSGDQLLELISDILDHAKIEADKLELHPSDIPLAAFLRTVCDVVSVKAEQKNLAFRSEIDPALPAVVRADEQRLRQVLLNLLSNAVKYTDAGEVVLRVAPAASGRLRFAVHDTGIGIAEAEQDAIFQVFEQVGDERRRAGGTGLGLAISRHLAQMMGGDIAVESRPGAGSVFSFEVAAEAVGSDPLPLPVLADPAAPRIETPPAEPPFSPPRQELDILLGLAQRGNMRSLLQRAAYLQDLDDRHRAFAEQLVVLANGYQTKAILNLVRQHLERAPQA